MSIEEEMEVEDMNKSKEDIKNDINENNDKNEEEEENLMPDNMDKSSNEISNDENKSNENVEENENNISDDDDENERKNKGVEENDNNKNDEDENNKEKEDHFLSKAIQNQDNELGYNPLTKNKNMKGSNTAKNTKDELKNPEDEDDNNNNNLDFDQLEDLDKFKEIFDINSI